MSLFWYKSCKDQKLRSGGGAVILLQQQFDIGTVFTVLMINDPVIGTHISEGGSVAQTHSESNVA